jgi:5'(3')-deoxyribonucleotidase
MRLFVNLDGVLADFDSQHEKVLGFRPDARKDNVNWTNVRHSKHFYRGLPLTEDAEELWNQLRPYNPTILTDLPSAVPSAARDKRLWVKEHFGSDVEVVSCLGRELDTHAEGRNVLVDANERHKDAWLKAGGIWIYHTSTLQTMAEVGMVKF